MSIGSEIIRQEAAERAMARYRARKAAEERRKAAEQRRAAVREQRPATGLGRGARRISREEAVAMIAQKHPRSALKLLAEHFGGRTKRSQ